MYDELMIKMRNDIIRMEDVYIVAILSNKYYICF